MGSASSLLSSVRGRLRFALGWPDGFTLLIIGAALLGAGLAMARQITYGVIVGYDGALYVSAARSVLEGNGFTLYGGGTLVIAPPLYPLALAGASLGVFDPIDIAGPLNAALFGLIIFFVGRWMRRKGASRFLVIWACASIALAAPLTRVVADTLSETLFILFAIAALAQTDNYMRMGKRSSLLWMGALTGLALLTRYIGVVIPVVVAGFLLLQPGVQPVRKAKRIAFYGAVASLPIALWITRNMLATGFPTGRRRSGDYATADILLDVLEAVGAWMLPGASEVVQRFVGPAFAAAFLIGLAVGIRRAWASARRDGDGDGGRLLFALFGAFALTSLITHTLFILYRDPHGIQERHLIPAYIPLLFAVALGADWFIRRARAKGLLGGVADLALFGTFRIGLRAKLNTAAALAALSLLSWSACSAALTVEHIRENNAGASIGYSAPRWAESELVERIRQTPIDGAVISNWGSPIYLYAGEPAIYERFPRDRSALQESVAALDEGTLIAWFNGEGYHQPSDFRGVDGLEIITEAEDGVLFRANPDAPNAFRRAYAALADREPVVRSVYAIYLDGRTLTYAKSPCSREETAARFFLHVIPVSVSDLPDERRRWEFDNLDFSFHNRGAQFDGKCVVDVLLPSYPIEKVRTGQFGDGERLWEASIPFGESSQFPLSQE